MPGFGLGKVGLSATTMYDAGFRPRTTGCIAFGDLLTGRRPRTAGDFCSAKVTKTILPRGLRLASRAAGNLGFRLPQWVRRRHIHDGDDGRRGPYPAP